MNNNNDDALDEYGIVLYCIIVQYSIAQVSTYSTVRTTFENLNSTVPKQLF